MYGMIIVFIDLINFEILPMFSSFLMLNIFFQFLQPLVMTLTSSEPSIYDIEVTDIKGETYKLEKYRGKVLLVVNAASKCGLADGSYKQLAALLDEYYEKGLLVLIFPCKLMIDQEFNTREEIQNFVSKYGENFTLMDKVVGHGKNIHPLFKYLTNKLEGFITNGIKWNFTYFLVDREGTPIKRYAPKEGITINDPHLKKCIENDKVSSNGCKSPFSIK